MKTAQEITRICESDTPQLITTEVFGAAYLDTKKNRDDLSALTHAVLIDENTNWGTVRPLCKKVKNIMDDSSVWTHEPPTCQYCLPKWKKLKAEHPEYMEWKEG